MKPGPKLITSLSLGVLASLFFLSLAFQNIPLIELRYTFATIHYLYLIPPLLMVILTFIVRTYRWYLLIDKKISLMRCFHYLISGFMLNCILPARMGEIARPMLAAREPECRLPLAISSIVVERLFDMMTLLALFYGLLHFITIPADLSYSFGEYRLNKALLLDIIDATLIFALALFTIIGLIANTQSRKFIVHFINKAECRLETMRSKPEGLHSRGIKFYGFNACQHTFRFLSRFIDNFATGAQCFGNVHKFCTIFTLSMMIWFIQGASYLLLTQAVPGISLGFFELTFVMIIICFFIALPSAPGFWGVWEAGGVFAMMIFGLEGSDVLGYHLINHVVQLAPVMMMGFISAWVIGFSKLMRSATMERTNEG